MERFEEDYASAVGAEHCVSCADGTAALYVAMHALGVSPGDEVITTAHSWISTSETIGQHGAVPVFVDIDPATYTIDPDKIAEKITPRTVGIIPVHLYGQPADMGPIMKIAEQHGLWVLEDCAQAHLATYRDQMVGTFGNVATWSFYPGKNLGAMGDAGAITTNDADLARLMARFARHGGLTKHDHEIEGINSRLDGIQAAILLAKLPHLSKWTQARQRLAARYTEQLSGSGVSTPVIAEGREHVYHLFVVEHDDRDGLAAHLASSNVHTVINYPKALPFLQAYARLNARPKDFPAVHAMQSRILSLPLYPEMTDEQFDAVVRAVHEFGPALREAKIG